MPDVVALEFEARAAALAELLQDVLDVLEGVAEDEVAAALQMLRLPGELELLELVEGGVEPRSEEHTSELQSLMCISYAVFCLNKKMTHQIKKNIPNINT